MTKTMITGVLKTWKEDRGFGFIVPDGGGKDIFIHISALKGTSRRPVTGDVIHYQVVKDNRGKYKAVNAYIDGVEIIEENPQTVPANNTVKVVAILVGVAVILALVAYFVNP
ncbi:MAG: cold shock domain-containing protein [Methylococcaceae bacterium]|jgi:cold shock CspA family protein|nr:cold shock domain-containing protein [Methylococcaceae bacterium]MDZ4157701.1 cold shock domain-containing protein [Methylococcales bacterium]MDP2393047.1 cold shock domain-containing protein [Methylococcaceae bacterium]MDP3019191.1 cold shock domain-containing protein [Methylococcaceae bacterium]MDP3389228.1 cold shock domain-containing protein [Methylococcaceae bacterium]